MKQAKPYNALPLLPPQREHIENVEVLNQVSACAAILGELKGLTHTLPNLDILLNAVVLREATASSEIENIITTQDKLYQALSTRQAPIDPETKEVLRYREAMMAGYRFLTKHQFLNTKAVVQIQAVLEENSAGIRRLPGTALRNAATGEVIYTPPDDYDTILRLMKNFEDYINASDAVSPLIKLAVQHYQFESIHPFYDGNGRTGRILNVLYLILHGFLDRPVVYLSEYLIKNRPEYYRLLQAVREENAWGEWIIFMLDAVGQTALNAIEKIKEINTLFEKLTQKIKQEAPGIYSKELTELLFVQPYCRIDYVIDTLGVTRPTASKYLNLLKDAGILEKQQVWKESLFVNKELFQLLKA